MLVPAGVLVLVVLGAIAVDFAVAFLAQRELSSLAASLANDAATVALSEGAFYGEAPGTVEIDRGSADDLVREALGLRAPRGITDVERSVATLDDQVCVTLTGRVAYVFARAIPGGPRGTTVTGRAVATAVRGGRSPRPADDRLC